MFLTLKFPNFRLSRLILAGVGVILGGGLVLFAIPPVSPLNPHSILYPANLLTYATREDSPLISPQEINSLNLSKTIFIDVRTPAEYQEDRIKNTVLIPLDTIINGSGLQQFQELLQKHPNYTFVLYCKTDVRATHAYNLLENNSNHLIRLKILEGGITAWRNEFPENSSNHQITR